MVLSNQFNIIIVNIIEIINVLNLASVSADLLGSNDVTLGQLRHFILHCAHI